jgi:hypothetical protein
VDTDKHAFDNTAGTANISGVYQWATKVYQAQVFNYGLRVMYAAFKRSLQLLNPSLILKGTTS